MKSGLILLLASAAVMLSGCATFRAQSRVDPIRIASYHDVRDACVEEAFPRDSHGGATNLDCFTFKGATETAYEAAGKTKDARNDLGYYLIGESNTVCTREMGDLTANEAMVNAGLSIATTALGTAGSIITGQLASSILAGTAATVNATRDHINAEVYRNQISPRVIRAIEDLRHQEATNLEAKFAKSIQEYRVTQMVKDINHYHQLCSYYVGLNQILQDVDRAQLYRSDPRRTASLAIAGVRAQITSIDRQLQRKGLLPEERTELLEQRKALRSHETELVKAWTATPVAADTSPPPVPAAPPPVEEPGGE